MSSEKLVYLCGPITGGTYEGVTNWREYAHEKFNSHIIGVSPMRHKDYLLEETNIGDTYDEHIMSTGKAITRRDKFDTCRSDMLLVNLLDADRVSIGSMMEIGWADANDIPIVVVMQDDNIHNHAMVRETASWVVPTLDEGIFVINRVLTI